MVKALTIVFLITLQLALQIGVPIHKHFCEMDGAFASVLVKVDHQCNEPHTDLPPCCQKEQANNNCCSDEIQVVKTNLDQITSDQSHFYFEPIECSIFLKPSFDRFFSRHRSLTPPSKFPQKRPPPLWHVGRYIQILHQTWQIWSDLSSMQLLSHQIIGYEISFFLWRTLHGFPLSSAN